MTLPGDRQAAGLSPRISGKSGWQSQRTLTIFACTLMALAACGGIYLFVTPVKLEINRLIFVLSMADVHAMRGWVGSAGAWAPAVSILIMIFQAVLAPLPAVIVTFANAALFGWAWGAAISWTGAMLGAILCYGIAMGLGRSLIERYAPPVLVARLDRASSRHGAWAVFIARLLPFVSFDAVSYAAGLLRLRFLTFLIATGTGQLPATIVYSMAGDFLPVDRGMLLGAILFMLFLGAIILPAKALYLRRKSR